MGLSQLHAATLRASSRFKMVADSHCRLSVRGLILGFKRARTNQYEHTSLIQLENVCDRKDVDFYKGKKLAYIYKAKTKKMGTKYRCIWGKVTRPHGNSGVVRAKFPRTSPPRLSAPRFAACCTPAASKL